MSACGFHVNGQYAEVSKCAMHLGHSISSGDRTERHSLQAVELSHRTQVAVQIVSNLPADLPFFGHDGHGSMAGAVAHKSG